MLLSNRLKKLREAANIDRDILAEGVVSYSHLSNVEIGRFVPSDDILIALAKKLNVPKEYLLKYDRKDLHLEEMLVALKNNIDFFQMDEAKNVLNSIKTEYPLIQSVYQETLYYVLKSYYFSKVGKREEAVQILKEEVSPLMSNIDEEKLPDEFKEAYYYILAMKYYFDEDYHSSYQYFIKLFPLVKENFSKAVVNYNIALVLLRMNNVNNAISYARNALNIFLHDRNWNKAAETDNLLGVIYWEINDFENAEKHLQSALEMVKQYDLENLEPRLYHNFGLLFKLKNHLAESRKYLKKSLELKKYRRNRSNNDQRVLTYAALLEVFLQQDLLDTAREQLNEAKEFCNNSNELYFLKDIEAKLNLKLGKIDLYEESMIDLIKFFYGNKRWKYVEYYSEELAIHYQKKRTYKKASEFYQIALKASKYLCGRDNDKK